MKNKIFKILGVVLTLALLSSFMVAIPASAAADPDVINAFEPVGMPNTLRYSDVGPMTIAPDGTIYATVVEWKDGSGSTTADTYIDNDEWQWSVKMSIDGGYTWKNTTLTGKDAYGGAQDVMAAVDIQCSPNYAKDGRVYVAFLNGDIYRLSGKGAGTAILLTPIVDNEGNYLEGAGDFGLLYDIDLWCDADGSVYILVACTLDVLAMEDSPPLASWTDMDLSTWVWDWDEESPSYDVGYLAAFECAFAPDFNTSNRMWAIFADDYDYELWAASTVSPGQWGQEIDEVHFTTPEGDVDMSPYVDIAFPDFYTDETPVFYAGLTEFYDHEETGDGNLFQVQGGYKIDGDESEAVPLLDDDVGITSVEVSGEVILAGAWETNTIYRSENLGSTFKVIGYDPEEDELVGSGPTGCGNQIEFWGTYWESSLNIDRFSWTHVYMMPGFSADNGWVYVSTVGAESAVSKSTDGGVSYQQVGLIDTEIYQILDMAFSPEGGSQPAMIITYSTSGDAFGGYDTFSLWRTTDIYAEKPRYERVAASGTYPGEDVPPWSSPVMPFLVEYALDGSAIMVFGTNLDSLNLVVWKSTDGGDTFSHWKTVPVWVTDWVVLDGSTIYCATPTGFYSTSRFGPPITEDEFFSAPAVSTSNRMLDIAIQPGFDPKNTTKATIILSNVIGEVFVSLDAGKNWGYANFVGTVYDHDADPLTPKVPLPTNGVYLAFDAAFNGTTNTLIYAADSGNWYYPATGTEGSVQVGRLGTGKLEVPTAVYNVGSTTVKGFEALEDDSEDVATGYFSGLVVSPGAEATGGNALYAMSESVSAGSSAIPYSAKVNVGTISIVGDVSEAEDTVSIPLTTITPITGTFKNNEVLTVIGSALATTDPTHVSGAIVVKGAISGAVGQFSVSGLVITPGDGTFTIETISIVGSALIANVTGAAAAVSAEPAQLWRLLLHEEENVWENAFDEDLTSPYAVAGGEYPNGLWLTPGSNLVWTIDQDDATPWVLEDTVPIPIAGVTISGITEYTAALTWSAMNGAKQYEYKWTYTVAATSAKVTARDKTIAATATKAAPTTAKLTGLLNNTTYTVRVRVVEGKPFTSRWSLLPKDFTTLEYVAQPVNLVPANGMQDAPLLPSFVWSYPLKNAAKYEFELSTDPTFATTLVKVTINAPTTAYTCTTKLAYDTNHYWRVRAVSNTGKAGEWCFFNFHTMMQPITPTTTVTPAPTIILPTPTVIIPDITIPPITIPDITVVPPAVTVNLPTPTITTVQIAQPVQKAPVYIWAIVAIGALLTLAVIVLIIRTRRVV